MVSAHPRARGLYWQSGQQNSELKSQLQALAPKARQHDELVPQLRLLQDSNSSLLMRVNELERAALCAKHLEAELCESHATITARMRQLEGLARELQVARDSREEHAREAQSLRAKLAQQGILMSCYWYQC